jgi:hypothetical protein
MEHWMIWNDPSPSWICVRHWNKPMLNRLHFLFMYTTAPSLAVFIKVLNRNTRPLANRNQSYENLHCRRRGNIEKSTLICSCSFHLGFHFLYHQLVMWLIVNVYCSCIQNFAAVLKTYRSYSDFLSLYIYIHYYYYISTSLHASFLNLLCLWEPGNERQPLLL